MKVEVVTVVADPEFYRLAVIGHLVKCAVLLDGLQVGTGTREQCERFAKKLKDSPRKQAAVYKRFVVADVMEK